MKDLEAWIQKVLFETEAMPSEGNVEVVRRALLAAYDQGRLQGKREEQEARDRRWKMAADMRQKVDEYTEMLAARRTNPS